MDKFSANELDHDEFEANVTVKNMCRALDEYISDNIVDCREKVIARERLEEFAMWATKAVAFYGTKRK